MKSITIAEKKLTRALVKALMSEDVSALEEVLQYIIDGEYGRIHLSLSGDIITLSEAESGASVRVVIDELLLPSLEGLFN